MAEATAPPNVGKADLAASRKMREAMEDTMWFKAKSGEGKTWGKNYIRILPPHQQMTGVFYWGVPIHFDVGPGKQNLPCPRRAHQGGCPICQRGFDLRGKISDEEFRKYMPSFQAYMNVIVLNEDGTPAEDPPRVRVWSVSRKVLDPLLEEFEENGDFTDLETGRDLQARRKGEYFETEYRLKFGPPHKVDYLDTVAELRDLQLVSPFVEVSKLAAALDAPTASADPWAPPEPQLPASSSPIEADEITQPTSQFGDDDEDTVEPEEPGAVAGGVPPAAEGERAKASEALKRAARPPADDK